MSREQDLSYNEIDRALGISVKTVETQMSRALKVLRTRLAAYLPLPTYRCLPTAAYLPLPTYR